ncbi:MAG: prolyl oligopeptidase family serine peptidase [Bacteroidales bacterium]|nr:prolyl oligopeptidase family serine peptidase [Bacteroidales bacterium]
MKKSTLSLVTLSLFVYYGFSQVTDSPRPQLTVEKIMQNPDHWIGTLPLSASWLTDNQTFYFEWKKDTNGIRQLFKATVQDPKPSPMTDKEKKSIIPLSGLYNKNHDKELYAKNGDLFLYDLKNKHLKQLTFTVARENALGFSDPDTTVYFLTGNNVFALSLYTGEIRQLTDFKKGKKVSEKPEFRGKNEKWLHEQQLQLFEVLQERKLRSEVRQKEQKKELSARPRTIYTGEGTPSGITISPDEHYITWLIFHHPSNTKQTDIPHFVNESGYTSIQHSRSKAGTPYYTSVDLFIFDRKNDTVFRVSPEQVSGIHTPPAYWKDYPDRDTSGFTRHVLFTSPKWSKDGKKVFTDIYALDHKDRWIMLLDPATGKLDLLDHQHDNAWIGGPGISMWWARTGWMPDNHRIWFQSEVTGYSHLYVVDVTTHKRQALTKGKFEIYFPFISKDHRHWYFYSNEVNPGERHFYRMDLDGKHIVRLTFMEGRNDVDLSPDEKYMVIRHSFSNKPWELYLKENVPEAKPVQLTHSLTNAFTAYPWRIPRNITFKARDRVKVPARLYLPDHPVPGGPAVIFVHGAGYLQNAHKWWSDYYHEYMFHNLLADKGYIVLDIDYRGSAGYGRDWRTAIYRHMGGKDLDDQVDGVKFLIKKYGVSPQHIGIYGGSYGGFITLMAMFTQPGVFTSGAALRSVTDWAHYNHGYTSEILNTPVEDSLAYVRSSPIYFADGLKGNLLMCHGMIDDNVHFQDIVRLTQRLIELGKDNWDLAVYPLERHGFVEPSSWTDEYKRILKLFETTLKFK